MGCNASKFWSSHCEHRGGWGKRSLNPVSDLLATLLSDHLSLSDDRSPSNSTAPPPNSTPTLHPPRDAEETALPLPALVTFLSFVVLLGVLLCVYFGMRGQRRARERGMGRGGRDLGEEGLERGEDEEEEIRGI